MPALSTLEAAEKLAKVVEETAASELAEIHEELFPEKAVANPPTARDLARYIRGGLAAEEIVDLWNVVFPEDNNVRYDEEAMTIRYNDEMVGYAL